jgi:hypothetical protein
MQLRIAVRVLVLSLFPLYVLLMEHTCVFLRSVHFHVVVRVLVLSFVSFVCALDVKRSIAYCCSRVCA